MGNDRTVQLKKFRADDDDPYEWLEWRDIPPSDFAMIKQFIIRLAGEPMDRSGD